MKLSIYLKKIDQHLSVDTLDLAGGNESFRDQLDSIIDNCKAVSYSLLYGLTQSVNDAHAPIALTEGVDKIRVAAEKKLKAILSGTVKVRGSSAGGGLSPVATVAAQLAHKMWKGISATEQQKLIGATRGQHESFTDKTDQEITTMILTAYMLAPQTVAKAEATVAARQMKPVLPTIDLASLGLFVPKNDEPADESDESDEDESDDE